MLAQTHDGVVLYCDSHYREINLEVPGEVDTPSLDLKSRKEKPEAG